LTSQLQLFVIAGTRPEIIKQAPLRFAALEQQGWRVRFCFSGQHREMGAQAFTDLGFAPDDTLDLMQQRQTPSDFIGAAVPALASLIRAAKPDWVAVQGDTTTALAGGLAAFYERIPVIHIEAGLRTYDGALPFPEEIHRQLITRVATAHAAPTPRNVEALRREGVPADNIFLAGNTGIDSLLRLVAQAPGAEGAQVDEIRRIIGNRRLVLVTMHRRESFGKAMIGMCEAVARLAASFPDAAFLLPVHHNPVVKETVQSILAGRSNVILTGPLGYTVFARLLAGATLAITDSGGIQEEAPALGVPVIVMRDVTERPEAICCGAAVIAGCEQEAIYRLAADLLGNPAAHAAMAIRRFPYGDGQSSSRILKWLATRPPGPPELRFP
jgi:UDP-N-acetylglucosamine 2-epimerase (non-hydrolysing)